MGLTTDQSQFRQRGCWLPGLKQRAITSYLRHNSLLTRFLPFVWVRTGFLSLFLPLFCHRSFGRVRTRSLAIFDLLLKSNKQAAGIMGESWFHREFLNGRRLAFNVLFYGVQLFLFAYGWYTQVGFFSRS